MNNEGIGMGLYICKKLIGKLVIINFKKKIFYYLGAIRRIIY